LLLKERNMSQQVVPAGIAPEVLYDKRLQERYIRKGLFTRQQLDSWLAQLEDTASQAEITDLDELVNTALGRRSHLAD
jgi:hypothetical protein